MSTRAELLHPYNIARRLVGQREVPGSVSNPAILAMLKLDNDWPQDDSSTPWCGAFVAACCALSGYERTPSLRARAWLRVGESIYARTPPREGDIVILGRGKRPHPGPNVIAAPGHVGFVVGMIHSTANPRVRVLGGNQGDAVSIAEFPVADVLGYRRLRPTPEPSTA